MTKFIEKMSFHANSIEICAELEIIISVHYILKVLIL